MTNEEKQNILDKHKTVYDGFVTNYIKPKQQELYVQDFANDKEGITINNKGVVTNYKNMGINESSVENEENDSYMVSVGEQIDMIGDGENDLKHGTVGDDIMDPELFNDNIEQCEHCGGLGHHEDTDEECEECGGTGFYDKLYNLKDEESLNMDFPYSDDIKLDVEEELQEPLMEQLDKTLDMFKRFKNY
jgi:hypothetical protein